jgi:hypothetical protein
MVDTNNELKLKIIENERKQININEEINNAKNKINIFEILIENLMLDKEKLRLEWQELNNKLNKKLNRILEEELLNN